jgi:protein involved in polysaccharide export with SLBB domain
MTKNIIIGFLALYLFFVPGATETSAKAYQIGPEDVLSVTFWQDNSLDATVKVTQDGKISLDIIGEIEAMGLTTSELEKEIVRHMSRYNKAVSQAVVRVIEYGFQKVYISGQVLSPGKYTFEQIPDLWTLINEAGGISESGDLTRVVIIRGGDQVGEIEVVNVAKMVAEGRIDELPKVRAGDTVELSRTPAGLPARTIGEQPAARNIFYVTGAVRTPGAMTLEGNTDVLDAIALAGGPTENANMKHVKVVSKDGYGTQLVKLDLTKYGKTGISDRYMVRPEDNIIIPAKSGGILGMGSLTDFVTLLGGISTAVLIYSTLNSD